MKKFHVILDNLNSYCVKINIYFCLDLKLRMGFRTHFSKSQLFPFLLPTLPFYCSQMTNKSLYFAFNCGGGGEVIDLLSILSKIWENVKF